MRYDTMLEKVRDRSGTSLQDAELAIRAVLLTLSERVAAKESADLASQLPLEFKDAFYPGLRPERFGADEFVHRVAGRAGRIDEAISEEVGMAEAGVDGSPAADGAIDEDEARLRTRAVFVTLHEAVSHGELEDIEAMLTPDYVDLAARHADVGGPPRAAPPGTQAHAEVAVSAGEFLRRVGSRAGLDEDRALRATDIVLETFGERIAGGEAEDLARQLPEPAAEPLRRPGGDPRPIPADEFVHLIGEREGTFDAVAREHARAVLTTVREAVTVDEWRDTVSELPREYRELL